MRVEFYENLDTWKKDANSIRNIKKGKEYFKVLEDSSFKIDLQVKQKKAGLLLLG